MLSVTLTPEVERRLADLAKSRGQSDAELARDLIEGSIEDLDDVNMAIARLETRGPVLTTNEARKALVLDG